MKFITKKNKNIEKIDSSKTIALSYDLRKHKDVELVAIGDLHVGSNKFELNRFLAIRSYILEKENRFTILNGDMYNFGIQQMSGDKDTMTRSEQIKYGYDLLKPIASRILSATDGNHEKRMSKTDFYATKLLMEMLEIGDRYREPGNYIHLQVGKNIHGRPSSYFIYHSHGSGGGRTSGAHLESLKRLAAGKEGLDLYIGSHYHEPKILPVSKMFVDRNTRIVTNREEMYVGTGAFVGYEDYAERSGMMPNSVAQVFIKLQGRIKKITAEIKVL